jgi:DNA-binding IclR family transcriptional regulator
VIGRVLTLLSAFRPGDDELTLAELHRRTGLAKPTVHRLLAELTGWDVVERTPTGIRLGMRLFELGQLVPRQRGLREAAAPFLTDLFEATHETVHLGVREGHDVVYIERIHGHDAPALPSRIGGSLPLTCTGVGKALLAFSGPDLTEQVLGEPLRRLTQHSITDPARLRTAIEQTQVSGLAYEEQEAALGVSCIAAPVLNGGEAVAALSVAVPRARFRPAQLAPAVRTAALGLSRVLRTG